MGKYYIRMDGDVFGPYTAKGMMELDLTPDIMVTEESIDIWQPANKFDFFQLAKQELLEKLKTAPTNEAIDAVPTIEQKREQLKARLKNNGHLCPPNMGSNNAKNDIGFCSSPTMMNLFPKSIEYKANFNEGINSIGGKIIITPTQLIFHPHKINFGNLSDRIFEINQISGYEKGPLTFMYISFLNGSRIKLTVWNKSEIIEQLEARRIALQNYR